MGTHRSSRWLHSVGIVALGYTALSLAGCAEGDSKEGAVNAGAAGSVGTGGARATSDRGGASSNAGRAGASAIGGLSGVFGSGGFASTTSTAGAASNGSIAGHAGNAGAAGTSTAKACVNDGNPDVPDMGGIDNDCDGIDGAAASSVFVSPEGLDSSVGTKSDPVRTIGKAIQIAQASAGKRKNVLLCTSTYRDNVVIADTAIGLHGGYDCATWQRTAPNAVIAPTAGVALRIDHVNGLELSKLDIQSADATGVGESSQAVQVVTSTGVHIVGSNISAGRGASGVSAPLQTKNWNGLKARNGFYGRAALIDSDGSMGCHGSIAATDVDFDGHIDQGDDRTSPRCVEPRSGGDGQYASCGELAPVFVKGGKGGSAALKPFNATPIPRQSGASGEPSRPTPRATAGTPGKGFGSISEKGYQATNSGTDGKEGQPGVSGQGGMGGGSCLVRSGNVETSDILVSADLRTGFTCDPSVIWGAEHWTDYSIPYHGTTVTMFPGSGGGQGGYGGCGGYGGFGGGAGGASIALFVFDSAVSLSRCNVISSTGGKGGAASAGTAGQVGGEGGAAGDVLGGAATLPTVNGKLLFAEAELKGSPGANGSPGEEGGPGGAGGGGPSIGILWSGSAEPTLDITVTVKGGVGGDGGTPVGSGTPGQAGLHGDVVQSPAP